MLLGSCDGRSSRPDRTRPNVPARPAVAPAESSETPSDFVAHGLGAEPRALALCSRGRDALLVIDGTSERRYLVISVGSDGAPRELVAQRPTTSTVRFCTAHGGSYLVTSIDERGATQDVLTIERVDPSRPEVTGRIETNDSGRITTVRRSADEASALVAYSGPEGPVRIVRVDAAPSVPVASGIPSADLPDGLSREVLAATVGEQGMAVLFRRGAPEDDRGGVVLVTERGARTLEPLHELAMLEVLVREPREVILVGSFEFDRPHGFRFGLDGRMLESRRIAPGEVPAFVPVRPRADVDADSSGIELRIRDAGGDVVTRVHVPRTAGRTPPALTRTGDDFLVATTDTVREGWGVRVVRSNAEVLPR